MRRDCGWPPECVAVCSTALPPLWRLRLPRHLAPLPLAPAAVDQGRASRNAGRSDDAADLDQKQQLLVLGLQLRHHLPQHPLQDIRIVRQGCEIDLHTVTMMHVVASLPMTLA